MTEEMPKNYDPSENEPKILQKWLDGGYELGKRFKMTGPACGLSRREICCTLANGVAVEAAVEVLGA